MNEQNFSNDDINDMHDAHVDAINESEYARYKLEEQIDDLQAQLATAHAAREAAEAELERVTKIGVTKFHKAITPYIAGGSEYTGDNGLIRAITELGEHDKKSAKKVVELTVERKALQAENARLRNMIQNAYMTMPLKHIPDSLKALWEREQVGSGDGLAEGILMWIDEQHTDTTPPATESARYDEPRVLILSAINSLERIKATSGNRYAMLFDQGVRHPASGDGELDGLNEITNGAFNAIGNMQRMMRGFKIVEQAQRRADELNANESEPQAQVMKEVDSIHALARSRMFSVEIHYLDYEETSNGATFKTLQALQSVVESLASVGLLARGTANWLGGEYVTAVEIYGLIKDHPLNQGLLSTDTD